MCIIVDEYGLGSERGESRDNVGEGMKFGLSADSDSREVEPSVVQLDDQDQEDDRFEEEETEEDFVTTEKEFCPVIRAIRKL